METPAPHTPSSRHPIQVAARRSGLSADVIRVWERRYGAVKPLRQGNRRLYSDADVARLILLRRVTGAGRRIGDVAELDDQSLARLAQDDEQLAATGARGAHADRFLAGALAAIEDLDAAALQQALAAATAALSRPALYEQVVVPLMREVGERWRDGQLRICHEHLASAQVIALLGTLLASTPQDDRGPRLVVTTPAGQRHEIGALLAALTAASDGWQVLYLGPNTPAGEIVAIAEQRQARAVVLSIVYPPDDPSVASELRQLRALLPEAFPIVVGGAAAPAYDASLVEVGALCVQDLEGLRAHLQQLRVRP